MITSGADVSDTIKSSVIVVMQNIVKLSFHGATNKCNKAFKLTEHLIMVQTGLTKNKYHQGSVELWLKSFKIFDERLRVYFYHFPV